jgi:dolichol-phosphate mannosyltransferase
VKIVEELVAARPEVHLLELQGNFGKSAALAAGFSEARGEVVFTLDADLQDDPKEIPRFLAKLDEGYDLVSGYKEKRNDPFTKVVPSRVFNAMVRRLTGVRLHDVNCGFKACRCWRTGSASKSAKSSWSTTRASSARANSAAGVSSAA